MVVGIDEAGRGPWAGPLVAAAVSLDRIGHEHLISIGVTDSKKLTPKVRESLLKDIRINAKSIGIGWASAKEIDKVGLTESTKLAMERAISCMVGPISKVIVDGNYNYFQKSNNLSEYLSVEIKGDVIHPEISAASIVAKVFRDRYMNYVERIYPGYGFSNHKGYGVMSHRRAIELLGPSKIHRQSFSPIREIILNLS